MMSNRIMMLLLFAAILLGLLFASLKDYELAYYQPFLPPCKDHLLGTNDVGYDILTVFLLSVFNSLVFAVFVSFATVVIGTLLGNISPFLGKQSDFLLRKTFDIIIAIPNILLLIFFSSLFNPSPFAAGTIIVLLQWATVSRVIRAKAISAWSKGYVVISRQMGASKSSIFLRHILPELMPVIMVMFVNKLRMALFAEATLTFLGLIDLSSFSLGKMIRYSTNFYYLDVWWNWILPPVFALICIISLVNFFGLHLEKIFNAHIRGFPV